MYYLLRGRIDKRPAALILRSNLSPCPGYVRSDSSKTAGTTCRSLQSTFRHKRSRTRSIDRPWSPRALLISNISAVYVKCGGYIATETVPGNMSINYANHEFPSSTDVKMSNVWFDQASIDINRHVDGLQNAKWRGQWCILHFVLLVI